MYIKLKIYEFYVIRIVQCLQLIEQTKNALNKIKVTKNINILHLSVPGCRRQGVF